MSAQMNLTNLSVDKKAWRVYMMIGNLPSTLPNRPGSMAILLHRLLPIEHKLAKSSSADKLARLINANILCWVFEFIFVQLKSGAWEDTPIDGGDGKIQRCFLIMSALIAHHLENIIQYGIKSNACPKSEGPQEA